MLTGPSLSPTLVGSLAAALSAAGSIAPSADVLAVKLILALCVHKTELLLAYWEEFDVDGRSGRGPIWELPARCSKSGDAPIIPLAPQVLAWLKELKGLSRDSSTLFPQYLLKGSTHRSPFELNKLQGRLQRIPTWPEGLRLEELPLLARAYLEHTPIPPEITERCFGYEPRNSIPFHGRAYFSEQRAPLCHWAYMLEGAFSHAAMPAPLHVDTLACAI